MEGSLLSFKIRQMSDRQIKQSEASIWPMLLIAFGSLSSNNGAEQSIANSH